MSFSRVVILMTFVEIGEMNPKKIRRIQEQIDDLVDFLYSEEKKHAQYWNDVHKTHRKSARNLIHYLTLRSKDIRELQHKLGYLGLSRLARAEAHTEASLLSSQYYLHQLTGSHKKKPSTPKLTIKQSEKLSVRNATTLFGEEPKSRQQRIMVTLPSQAAEDKSLVRDMIQQGMDVARLNCAHDGPEMWLQMIKNVREADDVLGTETAIAMDIGGPKIRTGPLKGSIRLKKGDVLHLLRSKEAGKKAVYNEAGALVSPAQIGCTLPEAFNDLAMGHRVYFDDGIIKSKVIGIQEDYWELEVVRAGLEGEKLRADKGINVPDSQLELRGLTQTDREDLKFIAQYADIVNFSFVNTKEDVQEIQEYLKELGVLDRLGIVYKIETQKAYNNLASILLEAMKCKKFGIMIARGDLAIEAGWNHLGEIQKEMLAFCNAAHVPIVWATQVLEKLAKKGLPSRSEITDAVIATKSECIMLNKGAHILRAIELLDQIIRDMERYQDKNAPLLPPMKKLL